MPDAHDGMDEGSRGASCMPRRIAVIGRAGAGKTTVALALGAALGLPVVHLDPLAWASGWRPVPAADFDARHAAAIAGDAWVLDGGYLSRAGWAGRLARADVVVLVEAPLHVCLWRIVRRGIGLADLLRGIGPRPDRRSLGCRTPSASRPQTSPLDATTASASGSSSGL